ncbi:phospholipid carrier-dependent glycosyltransferase [Candidatus Parcubacteria bacterium]|nr:phospholipid carrier-dependent glycosyltransferase [Candidatus Parcubacteria bacterium]
MTKYLKIKFISKIVNYWDIIFLGILAFFTRFFYLSFPAKVIFDEAHFGLYASKYLSHQYYFDIHPPLGKLLLAIPAFFGKISQDFDWAPMSDYSSDFNFLALRFLPAFFGSLLVILIYFLVKEMGFSRRIAFISSFFVLFGNAFIVQSQFILLDIILVFFIFLSLYFFIVAKRFSFPSRKWYVFNILCGISLAAAFSIKWTGLAILALVWFFILFEDHLFLKQRKEILAKICLIFFLPLLTYFLFFSCHFYLLPLNCASDCGEVFESKTTRYAYIFRMDPSTTAFFHYTNPPQGNFLKKFIEENKLKLADTLDNKGTHYYRSDWFTWPFMLRPIRYFLENQNDKNSHIYFFGNPLVWWFGLLGILGYFYLIIRNYFFQFKLNLPENFYSRNLCILMFGYLICFIPFATIPRFIFAYHYLPSLIFSIIIFAVFLEGIMTMLFGKMPKTKVFCENKKANLALLLVLFAVFASFVYFSPLTYGFPLSEEQFQSRMWLDTWNY